MVVLRRPVDRADGVMARPRKDVALKRDLLRQPPLGRRTERKRGAGDTKGLRLDIVITAVQPPHAPIILSSLVVGSDQQAARHQVFETVGSGQGGLEGKVIEWPVIGIAR